MEDIKRIKEKKEELDHVTKECKKLNVVIVFFNKMYWLVGEQIEINIHEIEMALKELKLQKGV